MKWYPNGIGIKAEKRRNEKKIGSKGDFNVRDDAVGSWGSHRAEAPVDARLLTGEIEEYNSL